MQIRKYRQLAPVMALAAVAFNVQAQGLPQVDWTRQTPVIEAPGDGDDPAIWLHPTNASKSLVIATAKNGGLRVYDLNATQVQSFLNAPSVVDGVRQASRLNNVDVQYGFRLSDGSRADVAVFSDRGQDRLRMFKITDTPGAPLQEIAMSASSAPRLYPNGVSTGQAIGTQATGYGVTLWRDAGADKLYALVNQRREAVVSRFELTAEADGFKSTLVNTWQFPNTFQGTVLAAGSPRQFEGMVVDQQTGMLFAAQEDVGIWRINLNTGVADASPILRSQQFDPASPLVADVEGLTIRYGANGSGALLVSSQGNSTVHAFDRVSYGHLGGFTVARTGVADSLVESSDGMDVTSFALPGFEKGLVVMHDGFNGLPQADNTTNFKFVPWENVVGALPDTLSPYLNPVAGFDPRNISPVPEPGTWLLLAGGLAAVLARRACGSRR